MFVCFSGNIVAQTNLEDDFINLLKDSTSSFEKKSLLTISVGAGNGVFSKKNNSLNANQEVLNKIFYNTTVDYRNTSGFGLTINSTFVPENGKMNFYQAGISPSYYFQNKNINTGISYTHFFASKNTSIAVNPFKNEVSGSFKWLKTLIRPSLQLVYSNGKSKQVYDTSFTVNNPSPPHTVHLINNVNTKINDFTVSFTGDHRFNFESLFSKNDEFNIIPSIALNAGSSNSSTISTGNFSTSRKKKNGLAFTKKSKIGNSRQTFALQSLALSTDFYYSLGKFFVEPLIYADYYLPATDAKRLATVFSIAAGVNF